MLRSDRRRPKVAIYVIDHNTSGPISRASKVAKELIEQGADVTVLLRSDKIDENLFDSRVKKIPFEIDAIGRLSRRNPQYQMLKLRPDILLVDEYPFVKADRAYEWEKLIDNARRFNPKMRVLGMSCDIPLYNKNDEAPHIDSRANRLESILVTGDPTIVNFSDYLEPTATKVHKKIDYVGFMEPKQGPINLSFATKKQNEIIVYLGGINLNVLATSYLSLLANIPLLNEDLKNAKWRIIEPANRDMMAGSQLRAVVSRLPEAIQHNISFEPAGPDFKEKLHHADMAITGGGQTAIEAALIAGLPTVIVPSLFTEQFDRADRFVEKFPDRVAKIKIPLPRVDGVTRASLRREMIMGITHEKPLDKRMRLACEDPLAVTMRTTIERIYEQRGHPQPQTSIMLDGAEHIAQRVLADAPTVNATLTR